MERDERLHRVHDSLPISRVKLFFFFMMPGRRFGQRVGLEQKWVSPV